MTEEELVRLEEEFPANAWKAFKAARERALASGASVLVAKEGVIYELFPDGTRKKVKEIEPPVYIPFGTKLEFR